MNNEDKKNFMALLTATLDQYGKEISASTAHLWWEGLTRFTYAEVRKALSSWITNPDHGSFAPKIADIVRTIEGTTGDRSLLAWSKVDKAVRQVGIYQTIAFDDPRIHAAIVDIGGWVRICNAQCDKELEFIGLDFKKRYQYYAMQPTVDHPPYLIGLADMDNNAKGHGSEIKPVLVGEHKLCLEVIASGSTKPLTAISFAQMAGVKRISTTTPYELPKPRDEYDEIYDDDEMEF